MEKSFHEAFLLVTWASENVDIPLCVTIADFNIRDAIAAPLPSPSLKFRSKIGSFFK